MTKRKENPRVRKDVLPTLRQKIKIYELAIKILLDDNNHYSCICDCMIAAQRRLRYVLNVKDSPIKFIVLCYVNNFPELYKYRPEGKRELSYWWKIEDRNIRKKVLTEIIEGLRNELKQDMRATHVKR